MPKNGDGAPRPARVIPPAAAGQESLFLRDRLIDASPIPIAVIEAGSLLCVDCNPAALRLFRFSAREQMLGKTPMDFSPPRQPDGTAAAEKARQFASQAMADGEAVFRWHHQHADGEIWEAEIHLTRFESGGQKYLLATLLDVSERQRVEAALGREREQLRTLIDHIPDPVYARDTANRFVLANLAAARLMGVASPADLIGKTDADFYPKAQAEWFAAVDREILNGQSLLNKEGTIPFPNGETRNVLSTKVPLRDSHGQVVGLAGISRDITELNKVVESHARLATIVEQTSECIIIADVRGTIVYVNPAFEKITGYSSAEAIGRNPRFLKSGKHDAAFYERIWMSLTRGVTWRGHIINRNKNGAFYEQDATITPVQNKAGELINYVAITRDVTHEVQMEMQLRQMQKMEAIGQLAGGVAHDFNNILAAILAQASILEMDGMSHAETMEGLKQIREDAGRAANLTRQLLLFSRRQVMHPENLDLNQIVSSLSRMLQRLLGATIQMELHLHPAPLPICADAGMMEQVLMNLAVNARDAMPHGGKLRIETTESIVTEGQAKSNTDAGPGRHICLGVTDTGGGIAPEVLPRIFEPFFTTKDTGKGTGMGLATVFGIVKQHRGWIEVDNRPPDGVTFRVFLPAGSEPVPEASVVARTRPKPGHETILWVEDEASVRKVTRRMLERHGYQVIEAANALEALNLWDQHKGAIALLLTDMVMPGGITGFELSRRLRQDHPWLKVILVSGYNAEIAGRNLELKPGETFIQKPFPSEQLVETIRRVLDES